MSCPHCTSGATKRSETWKRSNVLKHVGGAESKYKYNLFAHAFSVLTHPLIAALILHHLDTHEAIM